MATRTMRTRVEKAWSAIRSDPGVTREVDQHEHSKMLVMMTDANFARLSVMKAVTKSLKRNNVPFVIYDRTKSWTDGPKTPRRD